MINLAFDYKTRRIIRMIFWTAVGTILGSMIWKGNVGLITGGTIGFVFSVVIDEKFYKRKDK